MAILSLTYQLALSVGAEAPSISRPGAGLESGSRIAPPPTMAMRLPDAVSVDEVAVSLLSVSCANAEGANARAESRAMLRGRSETYDSLHVFFI
jgi:hypothetical protein